MSEIQKIGLKFLYGTLRLSAPATGRRCRGDRCDERTTVMIMQNTDFGFDGSQLNNGPAPAVAVNEQLSCPASGAGAVQGLPALPGMLYGFVPHTPRSRRRPDAAQVRLAAPWLLQSSASGRCGVDCTADTLYFG